MGSDMAITLRRLDPTGADRDALVALLVSNGWPFHGRAHLERDEVVRSIDSGDFRDQENDTWWVDVDGDGPVGFVRFEGSRTPRRP